MEQNGERSLTISVLKLSQTFMGLVIVAIAGDAVENDVRIQIAALWWG